MADAAESGLVVLDKPGGITSHDAVARVRRALGTRKVGHAGTLDPMATGVLVLGVNRATRLLGHLMLTEKSYDATVRLGVTTTTDDAEGEVTASAPADHLTEDAVRAALARFVGDIEQVPSAVSAIKVDGRRAYDRVRAGEDVRLDARPVTIHELTVTSVVSRLVAGAPRTSTTGEDPVVEGSRQARPPASLETTAAATVLDVDISVRCSSGTYVRAIARDLGAALGVGGHLTALRRTAVGPFTLAAACDLDDVRATPIAEAARAAFPVVDLDDEQATHVRFGRKLDLPLAELSAVFAPDGEFLALYRPEGEHARAEAVFVS